jgi:spectinomycin phosphotransferase
VLDDPCLDSRKVVSSLETHYGLSVVSVSFLPPGFDPGAAVYAALAADGTPYFLKVQFHAIDETGLLVSRALIERGVPNILAPLRTRSAHLSAPLDGHPGCRLVLYPYIHGDNAMATGLSEAQWRAFGATLRAVHDSGLEAIFRDRLRGEEFALPSAAGVRQMLDLVGEADFAGETTARFAAFWRDHADRIHALLASAEKLGRALQVRSFPRVLCHGDIHAANILIGADGCIHLIDWDAPLIASRERDLLFVVGSRIARVVEPWEEAWFFAGYGVVDIDPQALIYARYERIIEGLGEFAKSVFLNPDLSEEARVVNAALAMRFFAPGGRNRAGRNVRQALVMRRAPKIGTTQGKGAARRVRNSRGRPELSRSASLCLRLLNAVRAARDGV